MNCRIATLLVFSLFALSAAGCRMCSSTYDYCGPTYDGRGPECACDPLYRAGSIIYPCGAAVEGCQSCSFGVSTTQSQIRTYGDTATTTSTFTSPSGRGTGTVQGAGKRVAVPQDVPNGNDSYDGIYEPDDAGDYTVPPLPERQWVTPPNGTHRLPNTPQSNPADATFNSTINQPRRLPASQEDFGLTLEELRREDPSITNVEIISVEELDATENLKAEEPRPLSDGRTRYADTPWQ